MPTPKGPLIASCSLILLGLMIVLSMLLLVGFYAPLAAPAWLNPPPKS